MYYAPTSFIAHVNDIMLTEYVHVATYKSVVVRLRTILATGAVFDALPMLVITCNNRPSISPIPCLNWLRSKLEFYVYD